MHYYKTLIWHQTLKANICSSDKHQCLCPDMYYFLSVTFNRMIPPQFQIITLPPSIPGDQVWYEKLNADNGNQVIEDMNTI